MAAYRLNAWVWAIGFSVGGCLLLLFNFGLLTTYERGTQIGLAVVLAAFGVLFLVAFLASHQNWWRLIPGWTLLALAAMLYLSAGAKINGQQTAPILFLGLACAFAHIYLLDRTERWWAILPGGFMLVLAVVIGLSNVIPHLEILFIGMGLVFFLLYGLDGRRRQWWALIPATILTLYGFFVFAAANREQVTLVRWWPVLLILIGLGIGWQALRRPAPEALSVNQAPSGLPVRNGQLLKGSWAQTRSKNRQQGAPGEYTRPAPGASVEILPDLDE